MMPVLEELFAPRPHYADKGAGRHNADVLAESRVRPAFFDVSCLMYRLMYAKVDTYCKDCGGDDSRMAHAISADVVNDIADACRNFACAPVLAFDSGFSLRRLLYPEYKGNRGAQKKTERQERVLSCKEEVKRLLRRVYAPGYRLQGFCAHGYEGDDIIASFVLGLKQHDSTVEMAYDKPVVIVSSDHDIHQVVADNVMLADVVSGVLCDAEALCKHNKIRCEDVVAAKCVGGCKSDNVGNVPGCGEKTVAEFLAVRSFEVSVPKARAALNSVAGEEILRRNMKLVRLPYEGAPALPPLRLSAVWPKPGVPEEMAALLDGNGVPRSAWPSFADVTLPRAAGAVPVCEWKRKVTE